MWFGLLDLIIGYSLTDKDNWPKGAAAEAYAVVMLIAPYPVWGVIWSFVGLVCFIQAFMHTDKVAFSCAISLKLAWGSCFLASWLMFGTYRGFLSVAIWYSLAAFVAIIAGWPEPVKVIRHDLPAGPTTPPDRGPLP